MINLFSLEQHKLCHPVASLFIDVRKLYVACVQTEGGEIRSSAFKWNITVATVSKVRRYCSNTDHFRLYETQKKMQMLEMRNKTRECGKYSVSQAACYFI